MSRTTISEALFERFCEKNSLSMQRVREGRDPSPDYCVRIGSVDVYFEIKQLDEDQDFSARHSSRIIGDHVRSKINEARNQVRVPAAASKPAVLLIYNNLDPLQRFGTEEHDFLAAMYGEHTVRLATETGQVIDSFHGRNKALREDKNNSFSAVGRIRAERAEVVSVHLYENIHARVPLAYEDLPSCITFNRIELDRSA
jgi:hypothetical protein